MGNNEKSLNINEIMLDYLSSYSHRGKYYTLNETADFDDSGLWSYQSVWFSKYGNLIETAKEFIDQSTAGFTANELESVLHVQVKHPLLKLFQDRRVDRKKLCNQFGLTVNVCHYPPGSSKWSYALMPSKM